MEDTDSNGSSRSVSEAIESKNKEDSDAVGGLVEPYRFKHVAPEGYKEPEEEKGKDGLTLTILEAKPEN